MPDLTENGLGSPEFDNTDTTNTADCICKIAVNKIRLKTDCFKDLCSLIGLDR